MSNNFQILGDVNKRGKHVLTPDMTIKDILYKHAEGMKDGQAVKLIQLGGVHGALIKPQDMNVRIKDIIEHNFENKIMFLSDLFCPVDYLRFLTRFYIRELKVDNAHLRYLNQAIESIANGKASREILSEVNLEIRKSEDLQGVTRLHQIFKFILMEFEGEFFDHIANKKCKNGICRGLIKAQCMNACPADVYIPGYIELMKQNKEEEAYHLMRKNNPLSFICGLVCARPCEDRCRRGEIESTVGVRALKRYVSATTFDKGGIIEEKRDDNGKKVAIIGSGPAGLTASYYLARSGYKVDVYEAEKVVGGMLSMGIPEYRLPLETIMDEVKLIENLGVQFHTNTRVGTDVQFNDLKANHDAVLLATGSHIGNNFGPDHDQVETAVEFLKDVKVNGRKDVGQSVLVVGGGDVAMDAARTAIRLGAQNVMLASLETYSAMPASAEEKEGALEEGVEFIAGYGISDFGFNKKELTHVELKQCTSLIDDDGKFNPIYDENQKNAVKVDQVIYAVGQKSDISYVSSDLEVDELGRLKVDPYTFKASLKGIFVAGDMIKPGLAIEAIAQGKHAAASIDEYLNGIGLYTGVDIVVPERPLDCTIWDIEKVHEENNNPEVRRTNFDVVSTSFGKEDALMEAKRCMRCDRNSVEPLYLK